jgi:hypothetical protein
MLLRYSHIHTYAMRGIHTCKIRLPREREREKSLTSKIWEYADGFRSIKNSTSCCKTLTTLWFVIPLSALSFHSEPRICSKHHNYFVIRGLAIHSCCWLFTYIDEWYKCFDKKQEVIRLKHCQLCPSTQSLGSAASSMIIYGKMSSMMVQCFKQCVIKIILSLIILGWWTKLTGLEDLQQAAWLFCSTTVAW